MFVFYFFIFLFGACIGSFLNAWIWRLHRNESIFRRRSYCPRCERQLKNFDLIPVFSFLFLGGKCRFCKSKISWQYPLVELMVGLLYLISFIIVVNRFNFDTKWQIYLWLYWYFIAIMIVVFVFDLKYYLILDKVTIPAIFLIFAINLFLAAGFLDLINLIMGAIIGAGFFWMQYRLSKGRWVGGGDIRLGALIGVMLGWQGILITFFIAYLVGALVSLFLLITKRKKLGSKVPFGTFLTTAAIIVLLWGDQILDLYQKLIKLY